MMRHEDAAPARPATFTGTANLGHQPTPVEIEAPVEVETPDAPDATPLAFGEVPPPRKETREFMKRMAREDPSPAGRACMRTSRNQLLYGTYTARLLNKTPFGRGQHRGRDRDQGRGQGQHRDRDDDMPPLEGPDSDDDMPSLEGPDSDDDMPSLESPAGLPAVNIYLQEQEILADLAHLSVTTSQLAVKTTRISADAQDITGRRLITKPEQRSLSRILLYKRGIEAISEAAARLQNLPKHLLLVAGLLDTIEELFNTAAGRWVMPHSMNQKNLWGSKLLQAIGKLKAESLSPVIRFELETMEQLVLEFLHHQRDTGRQQVHELVVLLRRSAVSVHRSLVRSV